MNRITIAGGSKYYKTINPWAEDISGVWSPDPTELGKQARANRLVPSVFAGVQARMQAMADMPFSIYNTKGDKEIDNSDDYQNIIGFIPYPSQFMAIAEGSLVNAGRAYWYKGKGMRTGLVKKLEYWKPDSVTAEIAQDRTIQFKREARQGLFPSDDVLYMWEADPYVELGPPTISAFDSAMLAAEGNGAITAWVRDYMKRGAIKAMLLAVEGTPPTGEVERIETWFNKFMTGAKGLMWRVFNFSAIKPTIVGDGLEALKDLSINKELRYEIHTALGTRHLLEDENFATASARERQFYTQVIVPDARLIQVSLNDQILHARGQHIEFEPERLEIFAEDEAANTKALTDLFSVFKEVLPVEIALQLATEILNYDLDDSQKELIKQGIAEKKQKADELALQMKKQPQDAQPPTQPDQQPPVNNQPAPPSKAVVELDRWALKVEKAGKMVTWHAVDLLPEMVKAIKDGEMTFDEARLILTPPVFDDEAASKTLTDIREALNFKVKDASIAS
jgi:hypothetical protein